MIEKTITNIKETTGKILADSVTRFAFLWSVILMLVAHGFCFANLMFSHDNLKFALYGEDKIPLGRWLYPFFVHLRHAASPYLMGIVSTVFVAAAVVVTVWIFEFDKVGAFVLAVLYTTNVTLTSLFQSYIYDADADTFAILAACLSVYFAVRKKGVFGRILSILFMLSSLAIYQTYFCVTACIFLVIYLMKASKITSVKEIKDWVIAAVCDVATLGASFALYLVSLKLSEKITGIEMSSDYNGPASAEKVGIKRIMEFFPQVWGEFREQFYLNVNGDALLWLNRIVTVIIIAEVIALLWIYRKRWYSFLMMVLCGVLILYASYGFLLVSGGVIHHLMIFATNFLYLLGFVLAEIISENFEKTALQRTVAKCLAIWYVFLVAILGWHNITFANDAYMVKKLVYDNTALHAQTVWEDIMRTEDYNEEVPVVFIGRFTSSKAAYKNAKDIIQEKQSIGFSRSAITYDETVELYFYYILGRKMDISENDKELQSNEEVINMPCYPEEGYIKMIDGRLVVKMSPRNKEKK